MKSAWLMAPSSACRSFGLLKGACRWLKRAKPSCPVGSGMSMTMSRARRSGGSRSFGGFSHQSTSPDCSAAEAVALSGVTRHSTRSTRARFGPEVQAGVPLSRGL